MSDKLCITFTGGSRLGDEVVVAFGRGVLVGRSHVAQIRVMESDVSGKHLEIFKDGGGFAVRNLSRFGSTVDGVVLSDGSTASVRVGSVIEIGAQVRFRIDALPRPGGREAHPTPNAGVDGGNTVGTIAPGETQATVFADGATVATRMGVLPSKDVVAVAVGSIDESATIDAFSTSDGGESVVSGANGGAAAANFGDEPETEDSPPSPAPSVPPSPPAVDFDRGEDVVTAPLPPESPLDTLRGNPLDTMTDARGSTDFISSDGVPQEAGQPAFGAGQPVFGEDQSVTEADETSDGETQELNTRIGSLEEILDRKRQLDRKAAAKHWKFMGWLALVLVGLAVVWFANANRRNVTDVEGPFLPDGELDVVDEDVLDAAGTPEVFLEYPRDDRMEVIRSADSNEVEVTSYLGRDRDVPFRIVFSKKRDAGELKISLVESFLRWESSLKEAGFAFAPRYGRPLEIEFWETFSGWQEIEKPSGIPFVRSEYTRTMGEVIWHGFCYRLRCGDVVYSLRTEIPESYWKRGGYRLRRVPFMGLYRGFIDRQWDSPGPDGLLTNVSEDALVARIRHEFTANSTRTWATLEKMIDTLLMLTWGKETANAKSALAYLDDFQERKSQFYNERQFAYMTATRNDQEKRMRQIVEDCRAVFSVLRRERRYYLVNNAEVWPCQKVR